MQQRRAGAAAPEGGSAESQPRAQPRGAEGAAQEPLGGVVVTDYEAAWVALGEVVASKTQHGREGLLGEMARLAAEHRVPAGELSRLLRLHGVEVERARSMAAEDEGRYEAGRIAAGFGSAAVGASPGIMDRRGGHDGNAGKSGNGAG